MTTTYGDALCHGLKAELQSPGILLVTFAAPERLNALDQAMKRDLIELLTRAQMDDAVRVVLTRSRPACRWP
jgi:enoyl-CoA hydratase/carnithine racemase